MICGLIFTPPSAWAATVKAQGYWVWAGGALNDQSPQDTLYILQGHFRPDQGRMAYFYEGPPPRALAGRTAAVILTYRLSQLVPPSQIMRRYVQHKRAWARRGVQVSGLQIDFDSPTGRLDEYAKWLAKLRHVIGADGGLSITGLGDWLVSAPRTALKRLEQNINFIAFMIYHKGKPLKPLAPYIKRLQNLSLPYRLGLLDTQKYDTS
ncbi:MAG: DUF3142 domain-containing protein, partial [Magnetovibrio sp.]|nr:DUF3142 domain-containing protein [Magnetovibrio sp.]